VLAGALWFGRGAAGGWEGVLAGVFDHVCNCRKPARSGGRPERLGTLLAGWCVAKTTSWIGTGCWCGWDVALVQDAGGCVGAGLVVVEDVGWLRLGRWQEWSWCITANVCSRRSEVDCREV